MAVLGAAAAVLGAAGTVASGVSQAKALRYQAKVEQQNAAMDRRAAADALARGRTEEMRQGRRTAQIIGQQRAAAAANGVEVDFGSTGDLQGDARMLGYEDAQTLRQNSMREAQGYEISAWNRSASASANKTAAKSVMIATALDAGGQLLSSASQYRKATARPPAANFQGIY